MIRLVIDVAGGDNAPQAVLEGAVTALQEHADISLVLCGDEAAIKTGLGSKRFDSARVELLHAPEVIGCDEQPTLAIKRKKESSLVKGLELVRDKGADCIISAGSTGALLTGATLIVRRIKGVKRPALGAVLPTATGCAMLIDCGANAECKPSYLVQFAVMATAYMRDVQKVESPRVGLINNGEEAQKGNELTKAANSMLQGAPINFLGNCEGRDILSGGFDVLVCDGFTGNIVLKYTEGLASTLMGMLKAELMASTRSKLGAAMAKPAFRNFKRKMDYTEYGGAPLLGIDGGIIKAHGSSNAKAFAAAIRQGRELVASGVTEVIREAIGAIPDVED